MNAIEHIEAAMREIAELNYKLAVLHDSHPTPLESSYAAIALEEVEQGR